VANAQLSVNAAAAGNNIKLAPAKTSDLATAQASVDVAAAAVATAGDTLANTTLTATIDGTVTAMNLVLGQTAGSSGSSGSGASGANATATTSSAAVGITQTSTLSVQVPFSEANAAKLQIGLPVTVSFDALSGITIDAAITSIDVVATTVSSVATYYAYIAIEGADTQGVKPGMTAQAEVTVNSKDNVLLLASSAITSQGNRKTVVVRKDGKDTVSPITTGIVGDSGTEILTGLADGDVVVPPVRAVTAAITTTGGRSGGLTGTGGGGIGGGGFGGAGIGGAGGPRG
jgi:membrane fusion protein, macrolide-specific efflux system